MCNCYYIFLPIVNLHSAWLSFVSSHVQGVLNAPMQSFAWASHQSIIQTCVHKIRPLPLDS